jgi:hypothetical protein
MFKVNADDKRCQLADGLRSVFYPLVPVIAVSAIWAIAWARSVESRAAAECGPIRTDANGNFTSLNGIRQGETPVKTNPPLFASDDDQRN